ncbi:MAG: PilT/PilU family type 4a pilus ATPase [Planctomycetota bacterium]|jgi:twitching motility protein PilT|nr:PilT/PilU family type 4a pilus ATPase [Planctomycetota bacterium]
MAGEIGGALMPDAAGLGERFEELLLAAKNLGASDIHLLAGLPPMLRINGEIRGLPDWEPLAADCLNALPRAILLPEQLAKLEAEREISVSHSSPRHGRHRLSLYHRMGVREMSIRVVQTAIQDRETLGLPPWVDEVVARASGLMLVTGPTGSGKTTTLNYLIDAINRSRNSRIVTIEDPVEFEHRHRRSLVTQIEVGTDTPSFPGFLRHVLRLDPDVIVIGEMRDLETISTALTGAETGHLVLSTLHTPSAIGTAERIVNAFPGELQAQIAIQTASTLLGVISQRLIPTVDKRRRVLAAEVLIANSAVRHVIRERTFFKLYDAIMTGSRQGMRLLETSLAELYRSGIITLASAQANANNLGHFSSLIKSSPPPGEDRDSPWG